MKSLWCVFAEMLPVFEWGEIEANIMIIGFMPVEVTFIAKTMQAGAHQDGVRFVDSGSAMEVRASSQSAWTFFNFVVLTSTVLTEIIHAQVHVSSFIDVASWERLHEPDVFGDDPCFFNGAVGREGFNEAAACSTNFGHLVPVVEAKLTVNPPGKPVPLRVHQIREV